MNTIKLSNIIISKDFLDSRPKDKKIEKAVKYIKIHKRPDKPIVLNNGVLVDNYARYLAAQIVGLQEVPYTELQQLSYIIGKFDGNDKEYVWKNDRCLDINIGDKVLVAVNYNGFPKKVWVTITDVFMSDSLDLYKKHKSVIAKYIR